ncbi:MAG: SIS domain-containing protein, partial [Thermoplasmata archaeon]
PIKARVDITRDTIFAGTARNVEEVYAAGNYYLSRMMYSLYLGDWVSYYLALLRNVDPTPVEAIDVLKKQLQMHKQNS